MAETPQQKPEVREVIEGRPVAPEVAGETPEEFDAMTDGMIAKGDAAVGEALAETHNIVASLQDEEPRKHETMNP